MTLTKCRLHYVACAFFRNENFSKFFDVCGAGGPFYFNSCNFLNVSRLALLAQHRAPSGSTLWDETFSWMPIFSKQNFTDSMIFSFFKINFPPPFPHQPLAQLYGMRLSVLVPIFFFKELLTLILSFLSFLF